MANLTDKHRAFVACMAAGQKRKDAAIAAGYAPGTADQTASRLMQRADIKAAIKRAKGDPNASVTDIVGGDDLAERTSYLKPNYKTSLDLLQDLYNNPKAPAGVRIEAAKLALPYEHGKIGETGKKQAAKDEAKAKAQNKQNKFHRRAAPGRPHLRAVS